MLSSIPDSIMCIDMSKNKDPFLTKD